MKITLNEYSPREVITYILQNSGLKQKEVGKIISKSERTVQDYIAGKYYPNIKVLKDLCESDELNLTITIELKDKKH